MGGRERVSSPRSFETESLEEQLTEKSLRDSPNHHPKVDVGRREASREIHLEDGEKGNDEVGGSLENRRRISSRVLESSRAGSWSKRTCMFPAEKVIQAVQEK